MPEIGYQGPSWGRIPPGYYEDETCIEEEIQQRMDCIIADEDRFFDAIDKQGKWQAIYRQMARIARSRIHDERLAAAVELKRLVIEAVRKDAE